MRKSAINLLALLASSGFVCSASAQSTYADISLGLDAQLAILQKSEQVRAAVSYTHLDVYKRQHICNARCAVAE